MGLHNSRGGSPLLRGREGNMKLLTGCLIVFAAAATTAAGQQGQEVFEKVCSKCHGEGGAGSAAADNFYKVVIPRLNSAYVQKMSDAELREVITKGRRKMKPPLPGTPYMQHSVKPELLNDVVAYVRTLKKGS